MPRVIRIDADKLAELIKEGINDTRFGCVEAGFEIGRIAGREISLVVHFPNEDDEDDQDDDERGSDHCVFEEEVKFGP